MTLLTFARSGLTGMRVRTACWLTQQYGVEEPDTLDVLDGPDRVGLKSEWVRGPGWPKPSAPHVATRRRANIVAR